MKKSIYESVTETLLDAMETAGSDWMKPFAGSAGIPRRSNGKPYQGLNVMLLWIRSEQLEKDGYTVGPKWFTYNQAKDAGGQVRKGEKGTMVTYWGTFKPEDDDGNKKTVRFLKKFTVFNESQVDGIDATPADFEPVVLSYNAEELVVDVADANQIHLQRENGRAYYSPDADVVSLPHCDQWRTEEGFTSTAFHEFAHWTGHKSRLDRLSKNAAFGNADYAAEELVAEMGAAFISSRLGRTFDSQNSAKDLNNWKKALKADNKIFVHAAAAAGRAADLICETFENAENMTSAA